MSKHFLRNRFLASLMLASAVFQVTTSTVFPTYAQAQRIGIEPADIDKTNPKEKGWFLFRLEPGQSVDATALVSNAKQEGITSQDIEVEVNAKDNISNETGELTTINDEVENKGVGKWVELSQSKLSIPAEKSARIPFKLTVPAGTAPGEYAGSLCVKPAAKAATDSPLSIAVRTCTARIYVTVPGDLKLSTDIKNLQAVAPTSTTFEEEMRKYGYVRPENMVIKTEMANTGNLFALVESNLKITRPDGSSVTLPQAPRMFNRELNTGVQLPVYVQTKEPYRVGETKFELTYKVSPLSDRFKESATKTGNEGVLNYNLTLTQADLDKLTKLRGELDSGIQKEFSRPPAAAQQQQMVQEASSSASTAISIAPAAEAQKEEPNNNLLYIGLGVGALFLIVILLLVFLLLKKKKKEDKDEKKAAKSE